MADPVTVAEAMFHLRIEPIGDDDPDAQAAQESAIARHVATATGRVEALTGLTLTPRAVTVAIDRLAHPTRLRVWPIAAGAQPTVSYRDVDGTDRTVAGATVRADVRPAMLYAPANDGWPSAGSIEGDVSVTIAAGYATPAAVPAELKSAILVLVEGLYDAAKMEAAEKAAVSLARRYRRWGR
ncbi:hypothetical protein GO308_12845 [Sphingomonas sp. SFZ2018-12]|uniref:head-tail connector protein n=1 Tax=Sphingomonas sp. SFZ2018-12 TaxID=2683197 RepID=UPI001F0EE908|nr:hypothetical protein [Sphingomonas sp. SFZ2018-12]MCH4894003.1 hypothetical protein [Sphingomonas sp. SFZ2018-12]